MSLPHIILSVLNQQPASGYDLQKIITQQLNHFWQASHQQIYRDLGKMVTKDWIDFQQIEQLGKPNKKLYFITNQGEIALNHWLGLPTPNTLIKDEFLLKLLNAAPSQLKTLRALAIEQKNHLQQKLELIEMTRLSFSKNTDHDFIENTLSNQGSTDRLLRLSPEQPVEKFKLYSWQHNLALQRQRLDMTAHIQWLEITIKQIAFEIEKNER